MPIRAYPLNPSRQVLLAPLNAFDEKLVEEAVAWAVSAPPLGVVPFLDEADRAWGVRAKTLPMRRSKRFPEVFDPIKDGWQHTKGGPVDHRTDLGGCACATLGRWRAEGSSGAVCHGGPS